MTNPWNVLRFRRLQVNTEMKTRLPRRPRTAVTKSRRPSSHHSSRSNRFIVRGPGQYCHELSLLPLWQRNRERWNLLEHRRVALNVNIRPSQVIFMFDHSSICLLISILPFFPTELEEETSSLDINDQADQVYTKHQQYFSFCISSPQLSFYFK